MLAVAYPAEVQEIVVHIADGHMNLANELRADGAPVSLDIPARRDLAREPRPIRHGKGI